jgi:hypothetical protein
MRDRDFCYPAISLYVIASIRFDRISKHSTSESLSADNQRASVQAIGEPKLRYTVHLGTEISYIKATTNVTKHNQKTTYYQKHLYRMSR